jgi:alanine racemase
MNQFLPRRCWAEVDLTALRGNLSWLRHRVGKAIRILTVVKADAYGHGLKQIAAVLMQSGTDMFGVANLAEARVLRSVGRGWPVLMLGPCLPDEIAAAVRDEVRPTLSSLPEAEAFNLEALRQNRVVPVHVKADTGMGRLGAEPARALELVRAIGRLPGLEMEGLYTHFAAAEDDAGFTRRQQRRFRELLRRVHALGVRVPLTHSANSAAVLHELPASRHGSLIRPGLLVYGVLPDGSRGDIGVFRKFFQPALSLKCRAGMVKPITRGTSLSYGRTFVASRAMRVATLTAGYGDGYLRAGSNRAYVLLHGQRCRVLGRITMDQTLVDVTRVPEVQAGDEAVLIGKQGDDEITATELAGWCRTIPWEVLTAITQRVPRIYRGSQAA